MSTTLFKKVDYTLDKLIHDIQMGEIGLPDIQRPFVWPNTKVRDLFDSMLRGYPVGYLLFWANGATEGHRPVGGDTKQKVPNLLIVDGQQRLTSLYAVLTGTPVLREDFRQEHIQIAYRPSDRHFEVASAAIKKDPEFIPDISLLWNGEIPRLKFVRQFIAALKERRELTENEEYGLEEAIDAVHDLHRYPFTAMELSADVTDEEVGEVFVRINSRGTPLGQSDFILTLMSVFWDKGRTQLEEFCRAGRKPGDGPSPYNQFIQPDPDDLLRVAVGLAFGRGKLQSVYSILRGKDLDTGAFSAERRDEQFELLAEAQDYALDLQHWHDFFKAVLRAGFRRGDHITSKTGLVYTYLLYLIGKRDFHVDENALRSVIARWFYMSSLTRRYTSSPESVIERDLARLREISTADEFVKTLNGVVSETLTRDYWDITLPAELATTSGYSPSMFAYYAALNVLDAQVLFSKLKVSELLDPTAKAKRAALERHHLFPKAYLANKGITGTSKVNQIANFALVEWPDNANISAKSPAEYWPGMASRFQPEELSRMMYWHALPDSWQGMDYDTFLPLRRRGIAAVTRDGFLSLLDQTRDAAEEEAERELQQEVTETLGSPTTELLGEEGAFLEFKASARWSHIQGEKEKESELEILKTIAGFANSRGGTLLVGVNDEGAAVGLKADFKSLQGAKKDRDGWENWLTGMLRTRLGAASLIGLSGRFETVNERDVYRMDTEAGSEPMLVDGKRFYVRINNTTQELNIAETLEYTKRRWSGSGLASFHLPSAPPNLPAGSPSSETVDAEFLVDAEGESDSDATDSGSMSHEQIRDRAATDFVRTAVDGFEDWLEGLGAPGLVVQHNKGSNHTVRAQGRRVIFYYFAQSWIHFILFDATSQDLEAFAKLTIADSVSLGTGGGISGNVGSDADLEILKAQLKAHLEPPRVS